VTIWQLSKPVEYRGVSPEKGVRKKQLFFPHGVINRKVEGVDYGLKGSGQITGG
jgi:hypothetical protein